jgi:hypothetical protein
VARRRPSSLPKLTERVVPRYRARYQAKLDRYWPAFYRRIAPQVARAIAPLVERTKAEPDEMALGNLVDLRLRGVGWDAEARILTSSVQPIYLDLGEEAYRAVSADLLSTVSYDLNARDLRAVQNEVGRRITEVTLTSKDRIAAMTVDGIEKGLSVEQIVRGVKPMTFTVRGKVPYFPGIRGLVDSWGSTGTGARLGPGTAASSRSYLIALTETANAFNKASLNAYASSGLVDFVEVFDGLDCGWTKHDDSDKAHGSIRTLEDAADHPIAHPRCQRAFGAALAAEGPSASPGGPAPAPAPAPAPVPPAPVPAPVRKPRAPKDPADAFDIFADPKVARAEAAYRRARTAAANAKPGQGGQTGRALQAASIAREEAVRTALNRARARALALSEAEAKLAVPAVRRRIDALTAERVRIRALGGPMSSFAESQALGTRIGFLEDSLTTLRRKLPLVDRITVARPRSGATRDLYDDARRLVEAVESELRAFDLRTVWTGGVAIKAPRGAAGVFNWDQSIGISRPVAKLYKAEDRLKVILHEVLHSVSPSLDQGTFIRTGRGWEEGVVEGTAQWAEARIRAKLGLPPATGYKTYANYVDELDGMRRFLGRSPDDFWPELMRTPIDERKGLIERWVVESQNVTLQSFVDDLDRKLRR